MNYSLGFAATGLSLLVYRMWPRRQASASSAELEKTAPTSWPLVSIIVPARNEEKVLGLLLSSLTRLDYPAYEILVVDDCSEDRTASIALAHGVRLIKGRERPATWHGKQWACQQGAEAARGDYLLFTDADTIHEPQSLRQAIAALLAAQAQGLTTLPHHVCLDLWEKLCGPFHVMLLAATNPYGRPRVGQVFAIGQYLLFERKMYEKMGGHARVKAAKVEDIPLAQALLQDGGRWKVYTGAPLFSVRMYANLGEFIRGWRRNFRAGMSYSYRGAALEMTLFIAALIGGGQWHQPGAYVIIGATLLAMAVMQASLGRFSIWGLICFPFALGLFCYVSLLAVYDICLRRPMIWKNRAYS